ncbi:16725_t:CDS:1, partial [Cetraspora pellucida]
NCGRTLRESSCRENDRDPHRRHFPDTRFPNSIIFATTISPTKYLPRQYHFIDG